MATRAHSTRTPLLPPAATLSPLLGSGFGKQLGPVTQAIRVMRAAEPVRTELISALPPDIRDLRRRIAERIEADLALLDALDGDCDLEEDDPAGGDVCDEPHDPEEDAGAEENHSAAFLCEFNGYSYAPVIGRRRA